MNVINENKSVNYSLMDLSKSNIEVIKDCEDRINDLMHLIEFETFNDKNCYKTIMKLQHFLKKRRTLKSGGKIYNPRTETGKKIVDGKIIRG